MNTKDYDTRFAGIQRLYGDHAYQLLGHLHICVIGIGGVGSWAVEALARSGIGQITMIDYDEVALSNTNRQLHTLTSSVNEKKATVMAQRIEEINPGCKVNIIDDFINMDNLADYLDRGYDYVIDAIDSIKFKAAIIYYCKRNKIPVVTTGGAGGLSEPTMIKVADLAKTYNDPLAAKVRAKLREEYNYTRNTKKNFGIECVFSSQQPVYPKEDGTVSHEKPGIHGVSLDCRFGYGAITFVTATFGFVAVSRAIHKLLKKRAAK
ncbi:MAG: tRNA cyclic N6-threonylcarbamoyladenosine(37) synthase TcdA [Gammaproteobacteria bacterium]